jgi:outer membrane protein assembly factor BamB
MENAIAPRKPIRLWPGLIAAVLLVIVRFIVPFVHPDGPIIGLLGGVALAAVIILWWLFFSRAPWLERLGAIVVMVVAVAAAYGVVHQSISNGLMGRMLPIFSLPLMALGLVAAVAATRRSPSTARRLAIVVGIVLGCGVFALLRTDGVTGDTRAQLHWRWTPTAEERLLAQQREPIVAPAAAAGPTASEPGGAATSATPPPAAPKEPAPASPEKPLAGAVSNPGAAPVATSAADDDPAPASGSVADWPGFRGPSRDAVVRNARIETDWTKSPPVEMWRRPIGPGWSSFAVNGDLVYTQEQRGEEELVSCYRLSSGEPVWRHSDAVRFYESNGGPGPRGTPTLHGDRVYTVGATGIVNALDARSGRKIWSRDAMADTDVEIPGWGFASSPLIVGDMVVVAASGRLVAYDIGSGKPRWFGPAGGAGYSSPHLATINGVPQILLLRGSRTISVAPADGTLLWEHRWEPGVGIVQPALADNRDVLVITGDAMGGLGIRRIAVSHGPSGWKTEERWTSRGLKPYFNDFVVHEGHAFGFDGSIVSCIDLADGNRKWKGGRYGHGQMILLPDQDLLLVLSEEGELALVSAAPDRHNELGRFKAIEGKTWNHPVLVNDVLLVRNGEEMAAFRLARAGR